MIGSPADTALDLSRSRGSSCCFFCCDSVARLAAREKRAGGGADVFVDREPCERSANRAPREPAKFLRALLLRRLAFFVVALARPQLGKSLTQVEASGIDIMLVLDVSGSMLTKDFTIGGEQATRIDAIREVTRKFIEGRPNDRIGIIAFAGRPYVVSPMTLDHDWLLQNLERVRIGWSKTERRSVRRWPRRRIG